MLPHRSPSSGRALRDRILAGKPETGKPAPPPEAASGRALLARLALTPSEQHAADRSRSLRPRA